MASYAGTELFKICYDEERLETMLPEQIGIWKRAQKWTEGKPSAGGQYFEFFAETVRPQGGGWMDGNGNTRTPTNPNGVIGKVYPKLFHHTLQIDSWAMALSETDVQAYDQALQRYRDGLMANIARKRCLAIYGNKWGIQAYCTGTGTGTTTLTVNGMYGFTDGAGAKVIWGAEVFEQGDEILIIDPAGIAAPQARVVQSRTPANPVTGAPGTITLDLAATASNGYLIVFGESDGANGTTKSDYSAAGRAPTGFADLYDLAHDYEDITLASAPRWKPSIYTGATAGTPESMDSSHLFKVIKGPSTVAGRKINVLVMNDTLMQSFIQYFEQQVRFAPKKFEGGMTELTWSMPGQDIEVYFDPIAPHGCIIGLSEDKMRRFEAKKPGWENKGGSDFYLVQGKASYFSLWTEGWTWGTKARAAHAIHKDIREELALYT